MSGVACPILDEFGGRLCHLCFCLLVRVVSMFLKQLSNLVYFLWSKAKLALYFWSILGCLSFVAVVLGALVIVAIVVVVVTLSTTVGLLLVGSFIDFH